MTTEPNQMTSQTSNQTSVQAMIKGEIKAAMIAKDTIKLGVVRGLSSAFTNELVAKNMKPTDMLSDEDALAVIRRAIKQRKDSIDQFEKGGRPELAADEKAELAVLETFVPALMGKDDVIKAVEMKKVELGITDKTGANNLMRAVMVDLKGKADGALVKEVVDGLFS